MAKAPFWFAIRIQNTVSNNMRKPLSIFILLLFLATTATAQKPVSEIEKIALTAKVWGFLKYHHPKITKGNLDWDYELIKRLPAIDSLNTTDELSRFYLNWLSELGKIKQVKGLESNWGEKYFLKNINLSWIESSSFFSDSLQQQLLLIRNAQRGKKQHYVKLRKIGNSGKAEPQNEKIYNSGEHPPAEGMRLLNLFRYWNFVEYFFPYKYQTDQSWDDVLLEMIPKFKDATTALEYHLAMLELTVKVDDSHSQFTTSTLEDHFGRNWMPVSLKLIDGKAVVDGFYNSEYAKKGNWEIGDVITNFNGIAIQDLYQNSKMLLTGSNEKFKKRFATYKLFRSNKQSIEITVEKNGASLNKIAQLHPLNQMKERNFNREKWRLLDNNIGYINLGMVRLKEVKAIVQNLFNTKGIIIDIRNYPLGTKDIIVAELSRNQNDCFKSIMPDLTNPGRFIWREGRKKAGRKNKEPYQGKIVLLVNEETMSYAELTCMCLQTLDDVTIIGSQTAGADGNVTELQFIEGFGTNISGIGMFYPDKTEAQRVGIKPDIVVEQTINGIKNAKDEILEKAIEFLNE